MFTLTGITVRDHRNPCSPYPESLLRLNRNPCSPSSGISVQIGPVRLLLEQSGGICSHPTADEDLRRIGIAAAPAVIDVMKAGSDGSEDLLFLLDEWGPEAIRAAAPVLRSWLDIGGTQALDAADRLVKIGERPPAQAAKVYLRELYSASPSIRLQAAEVLIATGGKSCPRALEMLDAMAQQQFKYLGAQASAALEAGCP